MIVGSVFPSGSAKPDRGLHMWVSCRGLNWPLFGLALVPRSIDIFMVVPTELLSYLCTCFPYVTCQSWSHIYDPVAEPTQATLYTQVDPCFPHSLT